APIPARTAMTHPTSTTAVILVDGTRRSSGRSAEIGFPGPLARNLSRLLFEGSDSPCGPSPGLSGATCELPFRPAEPPDAMGNRGKVGSGSAYELARRLLLEGPLARASQLPLAEPARHL